MMRWAIVLCCWLLLGLVQLAQAAPEKKGEEEEKPAAAAGPAGCVKTAKACDCYEPSGKKASVSRELCEAAMAPSLLKLAGGNVSEMAARPKPVEPPPEPFVKRPIPWLIER